MNEIRSFVYYNGSKSVGANGLSFDGEKRAMYISRGISAEDLKEKIRRKLKLQPNQVISLVTGRVPCANRKYVGFEISDDEDVNVFVQTFDENPTSQFAELYVDIETSEEGVPIPTHGLHQSLYMAYSGTPHPTQSTIAHGEESDYMVDEPDNEEAPEEEDEDTLLANDHEQNDSDADYECHGNVMSQQTSMLQSSG